MKMLKQYVVVFIFLKKNLLELHIYYTRFIEKNIGITLILKMYFAYNIYRLVVN